MTLGQTLKEIREKFGLSQEDLGGLLNVSRQAITKWENDNGIPDIDNLKEISKMFGLTVDYLIDNNSSLPLLHFKKELDKKKYKNKLSSYDEILKEYYSDWEIYNLIRSKKMKKIEFILDIFSFGVHSDIEDISNLAPYYLVKKDHLKLLVNIKDWYLEVYELPNDINDKKFVFGENKFRNVGKIKLKK